MREYNIPALADVPAAATLTDAVADRAGSTPDVVIMRRRLEGGQWSDVTARQFHDEVRELARGVIAAGIQAGDRVGVMSRTSYEWTLIDYALWAAGAVTVPVYETSSAEQVEWILGDSGAVAAIVETGDQPWMLMSALAGLPVLTHVWEIDGGKFDGLDEIQARGAQVTPEQVEERRHTRGAADLAEIVYTSGTTGPPKGCMLSHGNIVANTRNCMRNDGFPEVFNESASTLLFLPLAHSYAQLVQYTAIYSRTVLVPVDMADAAAELPSCKPTVVLSVPRLWEKAYNTAKHTAGTGPRGKIFARAEAIAVAYSQALDTGGPGLMLRFEHAVHDRLVYGELRAALGGRVQYAWSAAAPLGTRLGHFFRGCGINVLEGYGLTETSPAASSNTLDAQKIGTVGQPIPGCTIRIAPDGEVLVKGHLVFQGYWNNEAATREIIDEDGWLHTGDLGVLDDQGFLTITGRKKRPPPDGRVTTVSPAVQLDTNCVPVRPGRDGRSGQGFHAGRVLSPHAQWLEYLELLPVRSPASRHRDRRR